jgi:hypothetical protein
MALIVGIGAKGYGVGKGSTIVPSPFSLSRCFPGLTVYRLDWFSLHEVTIVWMGWHLLWALLS